MTTVIITGHVERLWAVPKEVAILSKASAEALFPFMHLATEDAWPGHHVSQTTKLVILPL